VINRASNKAWFWVSLFIIITFFFPQITSKRVVLGQETGEVIFRVLYANSNRYVEAAALAHILAVVLIVLLIRYGNKVRFLFDIFIAGDYVIIAFLQNIATVEGYGFSIITSNVAIFLMLGIMWMNESFNPQNDFTFRKLPLWRYWPIPVAFLAFWFPAGPSGEIDFNPIYLLTSDFGVAFCLTTPVVLAILTLIYPLVNRKAFVATCSAGLLYGIYNLQLPLFFEPKTWWVSGVLHIPLFSISLYGLLLPRILRK